MPRLALLALIALSACGAGGAPQPPAHTGLTLSGDARAGVSIKG